MTRAVSHARLTYRRVVESLQQLQYSRLATVIPTPQAQRQIQMQRYSPQSHANTPLRVYHRHRHSPPHVPARVTHERDRLSGLDLQREVLQHDRVCSTGVRKRDVLERDRTLHLNTQPRTKHHDFSICEYIKLVTSGQLERVILLSNSTSSATTAHPRTASYLRGRKHVAGVGRWVNLRLPADDLEDARSGRSSAHELADVRAGLSDLQE